MALDFEKSRAYQLFDQGKVEGIWDPADIDFSQDEEDWEKFTEEEKAQFLRLASGFYDGEEDVTRTLAPYLMALDQLDPDLVEFDPVQVEMYLSQHTYEEAKHTDFFALWYEQVVGTHDTDEFRGESNASYGTAALYPTAEELARTALDGDQTEILHQLGRAVMHYMGIVEGQLARAGYLSFDQMTENKGKELGKDQALPGFMEALERTRDDEGRHIGHGKWLLSKIAESDPDVVTEVYQPMLENYVDNAIVTDTQSDLPNPLNIDREPIQKATLTNLQETIDIIGREHFDGFNTAEELIERREQVTATADD